MIKQLLSKTLCILALSIFAVGAVHGADQASPASLRQSNANVHDVASLQNGAKLFLNYCAACHSLEYVRYSRIAADLGLTEQQVMDNLVFTDAKFGDQITTSLSDEDAERWFSIAPPDLSLQVRATSADYVYSYLKSFYLDPARPLGWNNTIVPNVSMPNALWELQGLQRAVRAAGDSGEITALEISQPGRLSEQQFDAAARDISAFMAYVAEPAVLKRKSIGVWVLLYLSVFTMLAWLLKREYWKDVT